MHEIFANSMNRGSGPWRVCKRAARAKPGHRMKKSKSRANVLGGVLGGVLLWLGGWGVVVWVDGLLVFGGVGCGFGGCLGFSVWWVLLVGGLGRVWCFVVVIGW